MQLLQGMSILCRQTLHFFGTQVHASSSQLLYDYQCVMPAFHGELANDHHIIKVYQASLQVFKLQDMQHTMLEEGWCHRYPHGHMQIGEMNILGDECQKRLCYHCYRDIVKAGLDVQLCEVLV